MAAALTLCLTANALPVEKGKAVENANTFISQRGTTQVDEANVRTVSVSGTPFYVINVPDGKGFLIMGGDHAKRKQCNNKRHSAIESTGERRETL